MTYFDLKKLLNTDILECNHCSSKHELLDVFPEGWDIEQIREFFGFDIKIIFCCNKCNIVKKIIK
jgi:hypothetical protein